MKGHLKFYRLCSTGQQSAEQVERSTAIVIQAKDNVVVVAAARTHLCQDGLQI